MSGTSATFSAVLTSTMGNNSLIFKSQTATTGYQYVNISNTSGSLLLGIEGTAAGSLLTGGSAYATVLTSGTATNLEFGTNQVLRLKLDGSTGAATFSSSVQADGGSNGFLINQNGGAAGLATYSANSDRAQIAFKYAQNYPASNNYTRVLDIVSTGDGTGGGVIRFLTTVANSVPATSMLIATSSNVLIGTTTDSGYKLDVNGTGRFSGNVILSGSDSRFNGGDSVGRLILSNSNTTTYIGLYGATHPTLPYIMSFVVNSASALSIASTGVSTFTVGGNDTRIANFTTTTYGSARGLRINTYTSSNGGQDCGVELDSGVGGYGGFKFSNSGTPMLTLASTGAATFSSSVSAAGVTSSESFVSNVVNGYGLILKRALVTNYNGISLQTANSAKWFLGMRENLSSNNYIIYNEATAHDALTISTSDAATFYSSITATSFFESSDSRLKTLIQDNYQTKGIASITPKLYTKNGKVELGYYAQDFVGVLDSAVSKGSDDMLSLSYREVHTAKIYALEQEIKELKAKLN